MQAQSADHQCPGMIVVDSVNAMSRVYISFYMRNQTLAWSCHDRDLMIDGLGMIRLIYCLQVMVEIMVNDDLSA